MTNMASRAEKRGLSPLRGLSPFKLTLREA